MFWFMRKNLSGSYFFLIRRRNLSRGEVQIGTAVNRVVGIRNSPRPRRGGLTL